jgi:hypothetical protein
MDENAVISLKELKTEFGITISPTHIKRKERQGTFPQRHKPFGDPKSRSYWWRREIVAWLQGSWRPGPTAPKK